MDQITPGMTYGLAVLAVGAYSIPLLLIGLAVAQDTYPPDLGPLSLFRRTDGDHHWRQRTRRH